MGKKRDFTIQRGDRLERTVVGTDGQKHTMVGQNHGKHGHFTDEGKYRRAIEQVVKENKKTKTKKDFTVQRGDRLERTVVGIDGQMHVMPGDKPGKDGHFTKEGSYRRAVEQAVAENKP